MNLISKDKRQKVRDAVKRRDSSIFQPTSGLRKSVVRSQIEGIQLEAKEKLNKRLLELSKKGDLELTRELSVNVQVTEIMMSILDKGADVNAKDNDGRTALMFATMFGHTKTVKLLIIKGADINAIDHRRFTALKYASSYERTEIAELLKQHGALM